MNSETNQSQTQIEVRALLAAGFAPIPVEPGGKAPTLRDWPNRRIDKDQIEDYFPGPENVGIVLGKASSGLVDIDLDDPQAVAIADYFLPDTEMIHGRKSNPACHYWYRIGNAPPPQKYMDVDGTCLLELRSTGQQTLVPPSIHPSGEQLRWKKKGRPKKVKADKLLRASALLAAATLLVLHYPKTGSRNDFCLALAGALLKSGWSRQRASDFIDIIAREAKDEEWRSRVQGVSATAEKIAKAEPATGIVRLRELVGEEVVRRLQEWMRLSGENIPKDAPYLTDLGNTQRFVAQHGNEIRFCYGWRKWLVWDGTRWRIDDSGDVERRAKSTVRAFYTEASGIIDDDLRKQLVAWARSSESRSKLAAIIELAKSEPKIPVSPDDLDSNLWLLNCANGTIDLRTGELLQYRREDLCTKIAPIVYDPEAQCPLFKEFLRRILNNNAGLLKFVQRAFGYALTGSTLEQVLFIFFGSGANGKSTLLEIWREALGDYGRTADAALLMQRNQDGVRNDVARLAGARFVSTSETESGRRMAEVLVKQLTGGDKLAARYLYSEFFEFNAQFKLFLTTNYKPVIRGTDNAIWRRIRLVPFEVTIPEEEQDKELPQKLRTELPGILAWAVRGCLRWQRDGLGQPEKVEVATAAYRDEMDLLGGFIKDCCVENKNGKVPAGKLYAAYKLWAETNGERALTQQRLGTALADRGFRRWRTGSVRGWSRIALRDPDDRRDVESS